MSSLVPGPDTDSGPTAEDRSPSGPRVLVPLSLSAAQHEWLFDQAEDEDEDYGTVVRHALRLYLEAAGGPSAPGARS